MKLRDLINKLEVLRLGNEDCEVKCYSEDDWRAFIITNVHYYEAEDEEYMELTVKYDRGDE